MSGTFIQQAQNSAATSTSPLTATLTPTGGNSLVIAVATNKYIPAPTISDGGVGNTYTAIASFGAPLSVTFTSAPTGATTGTFTSWTDAAGTYLITFSDAETRSASITSGGVATWTGALGTVTTAATVGASQGLYLFIASSVSGSATTVSATASANVYGLYVAEYSGLATSSPVVGSSIVNFNSGGTGANRITTGTISNSAAGMAWGFCWDLGGAGTTAAPAGTSPTSFTGRTAVWGTFNGGTAISVPEDAAVSGSVAITFGQVSGNEFDDFNVAGVIFALQSGTPQNPFFTPMPPILAQ